MSRAAVYSIVFMILALGLSSAAIWVAFNIIAILKIAIPCAVVSALVLGMVMGWKLHKAIQRPSLGGFR